VATSDPCSVKFNVRVIPGSAQNEFAGLRGTAAVVRLTAKPIKGAANKALIKFLSDALQLSPADISIVAGHHSREKTLRIAGLDATELKHRLQQAGALRVGRPVRHIAYTTIVIHMAAQRRM